MSATRRPGRRDRVPLDVPVPCRNYEIWGPHPVTGRRACLYVGECVDTPNRGPRDRFGEHLDQSWGDTIPTRDYDQAIADGTFVLHPQIYPTKRAARIAERARIIALEPLYNWEENHLNPHQIPKWEAQRQRAERDRDRGVPAHLAWAAIHGIQPVYGWRRLVVAWKRLRRRQRQQILSTVLGAVFAVVLGLFVFVASSLSLLTSMTFGVSVPVIAVLWFHKPAKRRRFRYLLNESARWALAGAIAFQIFQDLFL